MAIMETNQHIEINNYFLFESIIHSTPDQGRTKRSYRYSISLTQVYLCRYLSHNASPVSLISMINNTV